MAFVGLEGRIFDFLVASFSTAIEKLDAIGDQLPCRSLLAVLLPALLDHAALDRHFAAFRPVAVQHLGSFAEALHVKPVGLVSACRGEKLYPYLTSCLYTTYIIITISLLHVTESNNYARTRFFPPTGQHIGRT